MQITVEWNKKTAAVVLFLVLGVFFVLTGARALYQQKSATPLSAFGRETGAGGCVTGYVVSYVTITVKNLGNGRRFGVSQTYLAGGREYDFYTVPVSDGQYVQLLIWRSETKERLEKLCRTGEAQEVLFTGKVVHAPVERNEEWYKNAELENEGFHLENVISDYVIVEQNFAAEKKKMWIGLAFLVSAALLIYPEIQRR